MAFVIVKNQEAGNVPTPGSGKSTLFVDTADSLLKSKNSAGEVKTVLDVGKAQVVKGSINCSTNPKYPAAEAGYTYIVSVVGKIGGSSGELVDVGDEILCIAKSTEGIQAEVGANWAILKGATGTANAIKVEKERAESSESLKLSKNSNLSDLASAASARANINAISPAEVETLMAGKGVLNKVEIEALVKELGVSLFNVQHYGAAGKGTGNESLGIQAAVEAAEAAGGGIVYFPPCSSFYRLESKITYKLSKQIHFLGSYQAAEIRLVKDLEFGECVIQERGTEESLGGPNIKHTFTALFLVGPKKWPTSPSGGQLRGYTPSIASGIECCGNSIIKECLVEGFYAGYLCREFGQKFIDCVDLVCLYGTYIAPNNLRQSFIKGGVFRHRHESFPSFARFAVHPSYISEGSTFDQEGGSNESYCFYKEAPSGVTGAFIQSAHTDSYASQGTGNAVVYDENCATSLPAEYASPSKAKFNMQAQLFNSINFPSNRMGNVQLLDLSGATAGTFKIVIPPQKGSGAGAGNQFSGVTTAAIAFNASNSTIQSSLNTALSSISGSESIAVVSTREGKKQILIEGKAALMAGTAMTLEIGSLTGTATIGALEMDPNMGPLIRPMPAKIVTVKNATGGTFTLTVKIEGVEYTTSALAYNATPQLVCEKIWKAMGHPFGVVMGGSSENGKYYLFFNGRSLNKTVEVTANTASLTGSGPEITFAVGPSANLALRHAEYMIDVGAFEGWFKDCPFTINCGTVGWLRTQGEARGELNERLADGLLSEISSGEMILAEFGGTQRGITLTTKGSVHRLMKVTGEVKKGALLALSTGQEAVIYPTTGGIAAVGYATALVPAATSRRIPVRVSSSGSTSSSDLLETETTGTEPTSAQFLKPSTVTAGKVAVGTPGTDYIVGVALAAGSGGKVKIQPRGLF